MKTFVWLVLGSIVVYLAACSGLSSSKARAFDSIQLGDSRKAVIDALGAPDVRERPDKLFSRYASERCGAPCKERLWFENRLALDIEGWSVELDQHDRVIEKAHWFSP